jgi:ubiquinone/menaquinone biosynthesis C-methylase UbiE
MLAPRKKLWSTPSEVIEASILLLCPGTGEIVYDIGGGEGNFVIRCSETTDAKCIGIEIDEERAAFASRLIKEQGFTEDKCKMICGNALEQDFTSGDCFFLYLVPRGLRIVLPLLKALDHRIRVVTYMSPLPEETPVSITKVSTVQHPDAKWPLYYYELN